MDFEIQGPQKEKKSQFIFHIQKLSFFTLLAQLASYLRDLIGHIVCTIFNLWGDDGFLRGWRGWTLLLIVGFREVESDEGNLVDGAVFIEVGVRCGAEQAGFDLAEWP